MGGALDPTQPPEEPQMEPDLVAVYQEAVQVLGPPPNPGEDLQGFHRWSDRFTEQFGQRMVAVAKAHLTVHSGL